MMWMRCLYCSSRFESKDYTEVCEECKNNQVETNEMLEEVREVLNQ